MRTLTQIVLAAALAAMTASYAARGTEAARSVTPAASHPRVEPPKAEPLKAEHPRAAQLKCSPNWTAKKYKSFGEVQHEVRKRYGDVRILRVALCGEGPRAFLQIVIISGAGAVRRVQIAASN